MKTRMIILALTLWQSAPPLYAAVDEGSVAAIIINSVVVTAPCTLRLRSRDQSIQLPPVTTAELRHAGDRSPLTWFNLELAYCIPEKGSQVDPTRLLKTWAPLSPVASVVFNGVREADNPDLFSVTGDAKGIGLRLFTHDSSTILPGINHSPLLMKPGDNVLVYGVAIERTLNPLKKGMFKAVIDFQVIYD